MTCHRGATRPKKRPQPIIPQEPPLIINCLCPHCNASFMPDQLGGTYLHRTCPKCGDSISPSQYDAQVKDILAESIEWQAQLSELLPKQERYQSAIRATSFWLLRPIGYFFKRKLRRIQPQVEKLEAVEKTLPARLDALARMRYYTSDWYLRTRIPLQRTVVEPFRILPHYDRIGNWFAKPKGPLAAGISAEITVGQKLLERVTNPESVLYKAQVVPNVYLPKPNQERSASPWAQTDCLLLTRQGAFVLEIKCHSEHIVVAPRHKAVYATRSEEVMARYQDERSAGNVPDLKALGFDESREPGASAKRLSCRNLRNHVPELPVRQRLRAARVRQPAVLRSRRFLLRGERQREPLDLGRSALHRSHRSDMRRLARADSAGEARRTGRTATGNLRGPQSEAAAPACHKN